jgi:ubiquinone/menaquinone biosynthesis C-methylase UbiE
VFTLSNFDRIAQHYQWMEALSFGTKLQRCRTCYLRELHEAKSVLIFGEGDGRFVKELLLSNQQVCVDVVDSSAKMLELTKKRACGPGSRATRRLNLFHVDALSFVTEKKYDAIVTNFFLDCLTENQVQTFTKRLSQNLKPSGIWIIGDFAIPNGKSRFLAKALVTALYLAFRVLAGLKVYRLPNSEKALQNAGLLRIEHRHWLGGLLFAQLWKKP